MNRILASGSMTSHPLFFTEEILGDILQEFTIYSGFTRPTRDFGDEKHDLQGLRATQGPIFEDKILNSSRIWQNLRCWAAPHFFFQNYFA